MLQPFKILKIDAKLIFFSTSHFSYHRYAESSTPRVNDTGSRRLSTSTRLSDSTIRGVDDSPHHWYAESTTLRITDTASFLFKKSIADSPYRTPRIVESESRRLPVSLSRGVVFRIRISPRIRSQNRNGSKCSVRDLCQTDLCKNLGKFGSLPCPFNMSTSLYFKRLHKKTESSTYMCTCVGNYMYKP